MLGSIRKFSTSIYSKVLLVIIIIPFVFWGMGSSLSGGNKNIIVIIDKDKYYLKDFATYANRYIAPDQTVSSNLIEELFSNFIGEKLIEKEIDYFNIKLSDKSLSELIKIQKDFKRDNKFSRVEYEKFLIKNNISAALFESNLSKNEKKKQLFDLIGTGITTSDLLINSEYNKINQKRNIELINLNNIFKQDVNFSEEEIKTFYQSNETRFNQNYKTINYLELTTKKLSGTDEYNDLFFKKLDEIDNLISEGQDLKYLIEKFNLGIFKSFKLNELGKDENYNKIEYFSDSFLNKIFTIKEFEPTVLIENENKYFIFELIKNENIKKSINDVQVRKDIIKELKKDLKKKLIAEIVSKTNSNNFVKKDFDKLAKDKNVKIQNIKIENLNDHKVLDKEVVTEIYGFPEKKIIALYDINFDNNFLVYVNKVENVVIDKNSEEYNRYLNLAKFKASSRLFNTYDNYIKNKYNIDINYKALDEAKNYFIY